MMTGLVIYQVGVAELIGSNHLILHYMRFENLTQWAWTEIYTIFKGVEIG